MIEGCNKSLIDLILWVLISNFLKSIGGYSAMIYYLKTSSYYCWWYFLVKPVTHKINICYLTNLNVLYIFIVSLWITVLSLTGIVSFHICFDYKISLKNCIVNYRLMVSIKMVYQMCCSSIKWIAVIILWINYS